MSENKFGKTSKVSIETELRDGKVILSDVSFTAPFKIMQPFYKSPDYMRVMVLSASAGIMEGDNQEFFIHVKENTSMEYLSQAYEKIHKMKEGSAKRHTKIVVEPNAYLKYAPLPTIPFKDSAFENQIEIDLKDNSSKLLFQEILTCGRAVRGEKFEYRFFYNHVEARRAGELIYLDNTRCEPALFDMANLGMYEGFTHLLNMVFFNIPKDEEWFTKVRELLDETDDIEGGATITAGGDATVRALGRGAEPLLKLSDQIQNL